VEVDELSETLEPSFEPVPGDTRAYVIRNGEGDSLWLEDLESAVAELENAAENDELTFDAATVRGALESLSPSAEPFRMGAWSAEVHMVDPDWLAQLPEHDGW
jgi:hypothetical protein